MNKPGAAESLGNTAARGSLVLGAVGLVENGAQILRAALLARILTPSDFGLMGMAFVAVQAADALSQTGLYRALVQKTGDPRGYLDTVWVVTALRGFVLFAVAWLVSPLVAGFFMTPALDPVLRALAAVFVIQGFLNPAFFLLEREFAFGAYAAPRMAGILVDLVLSVALAMVLGNIWAMVWGFLGGQMVYVAGSYMVRPWRPWMRFRMDQARELHGYGRHIFRATAVEYLTSQADRILVGRLLGAELLGLYSFAWRMASFPSRGLYMVVYRVAFPVFSRIQGESDRLRSGIRRALGLMAAIAAPIALGLWAVAPDLVVLLFGSSWRGMIPAFHVACLGGVGLALYYLLASALNGIGRPELSARGAYVLLAVVIIPLYPAVLFGGIVGASWCVSLAGTVAFIVLLFTAAGAVGASPREMFRPFFPSVLAAAGMAAVIVAGRARIAAPPGWLILSAEIGVGAAIYALLLLALDRLLGGEIGSTMGTLVRALGRASRSRRMSAPDGNS